MHLFNSKEQLKKYKNAEFMMKNNAVFCIEEEKFNSSFLKENIEKLISNRGLLISLSKNVRKQFVKNSPKLISNLAKNELGFEPNKDLESLIQKTFIWYKNFLRNE